MPAANQQPELDFESGLPAGREWFQVWWLARHWHCTTQHVINLVDEGAFTVGGIAPIDIARKHEKTRSTTRIPRGAVIAFQKSRMKSV